MSTIEAPSPEAVEEQMGRLVTDLAGTLGVLLVSLGTRVGLWTALAGAGPLSVEQVAARVDVDRALVREWLRAQAAGGYLDYDAQDDTFTLNDATAGAIVYGPGGAIVEACLPMLTSMTQGFDDLAAAFGSGRGFGWHERTPAHWHGTDAFTRTTLPAELVAATIAAIPDIASTLAAGGTVLDVGCGYGAPTIGLASTFPAATVLGVDYHDASVMHARDAGTDVGNVRFEVASATALPGSGYDLITYFDSLHDLGDPRAALAEAHRVLAPGGAVVLFEPPGGDAVVDNLNPGGRMYYAISTLVCTPNAVSQRTPASSEPLGAQAGEPTLRALAAEAGFTSVRRLDAPVPMNLVLELRA